MIKNNIILIGMPGAGKSTVGVLLAKAMKMPFMDTDLLIQQKENMLLQDIIKAYGIESFLRIEQDTLLEISVENCVIATGGSAVYSEKAMEHLRRHGVIVYLNLKYYQIERRINNITTRGIAMNKEQNLKDLYHERTPLYEKYADITIDCAQKHIEQIVSETAEKSSRYLAGL